MPSSSTGVIDKSLLGRALAELRAGQSQRIAAQRADVSTSTWNQWETGKRLPRDSQFKRIFQALDCTEEDLRATVWRLQGEAFLLKGSELGSLAAATLAGYLNKVEPKELDLLFLPDAVATALLRLQAKIISLEADLEALTLALNSED